jgi:hypothetical protein
MNTDSEHGTGRAGRAAMPLLMALLLVVGLLVGGGISYLVWADGEGGAAAEEDCSRYRTVDLAVGPEMYGVVTHALAEVTPACTRVDPSLRTGGEVARGVATGGALPDVWIPEARFWTTRTFLGEAARVRILSPSLASTPVLLVGGPRGHRFESWGEAEVSGTVTVPDPQTSTVGALAAVAPQAEAAAVGRTLDEARQQLVPFAQNYGARRSRGADEDVSPAMFAPESPRLVVTTEQELAGVQDAEHLRDLTPVVGAPVLDFPLVLRRGAAPGSRRVAEDLLQFLAGDAGQAAIGEQGLRTPDGRAPEAASSGTVPVLPAPPAPAVAAAVQSWRTLAVPSAILAVVDASGSMDFDAGTGTRMELLADAASIGLSSLPDHARVGLWVFSIDKGGPGQDWQELEPIHRLDDLRFGRTQRFALRDRAQQMPSLTDGGTGLYDTALAAYREAVREYRPHYSNAVVLMTDGRNDDPDSIGLEELLQRLEELRDPARPVRLVGIAISQDADLQALERMARVTGGDAYLAAEPQDILGVFAQAVLSR